MGDENQNQTGDPLSEPSGIDDWPETAKEHTRSLRKQAANYRVKAKEATGQVRDLKLQIALTEATGSKKSATMAKFLLADSGQLADLDVDAEDFADTLKDRLTALRAEYPELRGGSATSGGGDTRGRGDTGPQRLTSADLPTMTPEQIVAAKDRGLLDHLLGRR